MFKMTYNPTETIFELDEDCIEQIVKQQKAAGSAYNEHQLTLLVEGWIDFISCATQHFMRQKGIGSAVWIFEQLKELNSYLKTHPYANSKKEEQLEFVKLQASLSAYRVLMQNWRYQPEWLHILGKALNRLSLLSIGRFEGLKLEKYQGASLEESHRIEAHALFESMLDVAINTLKNSSIYEEAKQSGHLYYNLIANLPSNEQEKISPLLMTLHAETLLQQPGIVFSASFFQAAGSQNIQGEGKKRKREELEKLGEENLVVNNSCASKIPRIT